MNKNQDKKSCCCDPETIRRQEIKDDIKTIRTYSTWILGLLVVILLALGGLLSNDSGIKYFGAEQDILNHGLKALVIGLFYIYLLAVAIYTIALMKINFKNFDNKTNEAELQKILKKLASGFNALMSLFVVPLAFCFFVVSLFIFFPSYAVDSYLWVQSLFS